MSALSYDFSTIDWSTAQTSSKANSRLDPQSPNIGSGCMLDAPGYPSHFIQTLWDRTGDIADYYLINAERKMIYLGHEQIKEDLRSLWRPLPYESERVQLWIAHVYAYFKHCYGNPANGDKQRNVDKSIIWPVPSYQFPVDPRKIKMRWHMTELKFEDLSAEVQHRELTAYRTAKKAILAAAWNAAKDPANHLAVLMIRKFYPEHQPNLDYIKNPPQVFQTEWIDVFDHRPAESECPGYLGTPHGEYDNCRMCGRLNIVKGI